MISAIPFCKSCGLACVDRTPFGPYHCSKCIGLGRHLYDSNHRDRYQKARAEVKCCQCKQLKPSLDFSHRENVCNPCFEAGEIRKCKNRKLKEKRVAKAARVREAQAKSLSTGGPSWKPGKVDRSGSGGTYSERNANLLSLGFNDYGEYLASPMWAAVRRKAFAFHGKQCQLCLDKAVQIHHNWYGVKDLKGERVCNLRPVCGGCHKAIEYSNGKKVNLDEARKQFDYLRDVALLQYDKVSKREKKQLRKMTDEQRRYALEHLSWLRHDKHSVK